MSMTTLLPSASVSEIGSGKVPGTPSGSPSTRCTTVPSAAAIVCLPKIV